jgi:hypothetical protein
LADRLLVRSAPTWPLNHHTVAIGKTICLKGGVTGD